MNFDPFTDDPKIDLAYPADQKSLIIDSEGFLLNGLIEIAQGKGPHPTILFLHGFPGTEKNLDIAHVLRRAGFNVVIFSYRGSWGSKGSYSFKNNIIDCHNVLNFLRNHHKDFRIKRDDIIVIGNSLGGFNALYTVFKEPTIRRVASISGFFLPKVKYLLENDEEHKKILLDLFNTSLNPLDGTTYENLIQELLAIDSWDFSGYYETLASKDLLLVSTLKDEVVPPELYEFPFIKELEKFNPNDLTQKTFYDASHSYSDHRIKLTKVLLDWLQK